MDDALNIKTESELVYEILGYEIDKENLSKKKDHLESELSKWNPSGQTCCRADAPRREYDPPTLKKVERNYPEPTSDLKVNWLKAFGFTIVTVLMMNIGSVFSVLLFLLGAVGFLPSLVYGIYYLIFKHSKLKSADKERVRNSVEFQSMLAKLDAQYDQQDAKLKVQYDAEKAEFDKKKSVIVKKYSAELSDISLKLNEVESKLSIVYKNYNCIPNRYRKVPALMAIYSYMEQRNHSLEEAISDYEQKLRDDAVAARAREEARKAAEAQRLHEQIEWEYQQQEMMKHQMQEEYYESQSSGSHSFIRDVAATAAGSYIANRSIKRELERGRKEEAERQKKLDAEKREERHRAAIQSQIEWENVRKANEERRRKGQPELPYPYRFYS